MSDTTPPDITQPSADERRWVQICTFITAAELGTPDPWISASGEQIYEADEVRRADDWVRVMLEGKEVAALPERHVFRIEWVSAPDSGTLVTPSFCGLNTLHGPHWCPGHGPAAENRIKQARGLRLP